jgi:hypothetical protein
LPDFSWYNIPKRVKMYQNGGKYTKWPLNMLNGRKINPGCYIPTFSIGRPSKIYPKLDFWLDKTHLATLRFTTPEF